MTAALDRATIQQLANELLEAERSRVPIGPLTERYPEIGVRDAYAVQLAIIAHKTAAGARVVGKKIGLTSLAMQRQEDGADGRGRDQDVDPGDGLGRRAGRDQIRSAALQGAAHQSLIGQ